MIYTITLNPALDISGTVGHLLPNEKNYVDNETRTPGGNGINAAIVGHRMGADVLATGFLGGSTGEEIKLLLKKEKVKHHFVPIAGNTRMNLTVSNVKGHLQTRLSFRGPLIRPKELAAMKKFINRISPSDIVIIGGSLPPGVTPDFMHQMASVLKRKKIFCMVDMPAVSLKKMIHCGPSFIKPNLLEFIELTGKKVRSIKSVLSQIEKTLSFIPLVCVSSVEGGAILKRGKEAWFGKIPNVKIRSTVGAGDSMVGAMATVLHESRDCSTCVLLGIGLAAACATLTEPCMMLGCKKSILNYLPKIHLQKLS